MENLLQWQGVANPRPAGKVLKGKYEGSYLGKAMTFSDE